MEREIEGERDREREREGEKEVGERGRGGREWERMCNAIPCYIYTHNYEIMSS